jgi:hypothetical protein
MLEPAKPIAAATASRISDSFVTHA